MSQHGYPQQPNPWAQPAQPANPWVPAPQPPPQQHQYYGDAGAAYQVTERAERCCGRHSGAAAAAPPIHTHCSPARASRRAAEPVNSTLCWLPLQAPMQAPPQPAAPAADAGFPSADALMTGFAGNMLRQQGQSYLQRGQAFMQSKMGFLSGGVLHYQFSVTPEYGARPRRLGGPGGAGGQPSTVEQNAGWRRREERPAAEGAAAPAALPREAKACAGAGAPGCNPACTPVAPSTPARAARSKLLMLLAPFLKKWSYTRALEQISGGHKYLPPRQDVNAPDLYIPLCAAWCAGRGGTRRGRPAGWAEGAASRNAVAHSTVWPGRHASAVAVGLGEAELWCV